MKICPHKCDLSRYRPVLRDTKVWLLNTDKNTSVDPRHYKELGPRLYEIVKRYNANIIQKWNKNGKT